MEKNHLDIRQSTPVYLYEEVELQTHLPVVVLQYPPLVHEGTQYPAGAHNRVLLKGITFRAILFKNPRIPAATSSILRVAHTMSCVTCHGARYYSCKISKTVLFIQYEI